MSDLPEDDAAPPLATWHHSRRSRIPLVWIVPLVAALIGGWIAVRALAAKGPTIEVRFSGAEGISAGKTKVRYKEVEVGQVRSVAFAEDLHTVVVTIDMDRFAKRLLVTGTRFWVVRPRLGTSGVSGLGTLLSGDYIGMDVGTPGAPARSFTALPAPPAVAGDVAGTQVLLDANDLGSLGVGAPAYFRHIRVGQITSFRLNSDGRGVTLGLFIEAPYDRFLSADSRFWHASGIDVSLNAGGVHVQAQSLATILAGGVAFETPDSSSAAPIATPGMHFHLATDRELALRAPDRIVEPYILYFQESVRGLLPGASVNFRGVDIGEVTSLKVEYDRANRKFRFPVLIDVYPERIRSRYIDGSSEPEVHSHALVSTMIDEGLRAQLRTGNLLTGQLYIALDFFPRGSRIAPHPELTPMPLPTIPGNLEEIETSVASIARKIDGLPLQKIVGDLDDSLGTLHRVLGRTDTLVGNVDDHLLPVTEGALEEARATLSQTHEALAPDASLQTDLHSTLSSVKRAADSIRVLTDYLDQHPEALIRGKAHEHP